MVFKRVEVFMYDRGTFVDKITTRMSLGRLGEKCPICDGSEDTSKFTIHPDVFEVPISLHERFRVIVHIVCQDFGHSTTCSF